MRLYKILAQSGHVIVQADNGLTAISVYKVAKPDVVLMDITMPEMDGLTALKKIKAFDPQARVIMLTALGHDAVILEAIQAGALDFAIKPFEPAQILAMIDKALTSTPIG